MAALCPVSRPDAPPPPPPGGSIGDITAVLRLLSDNYIELGIAQADLLDNAYKKNSNLRAIAGLYTEACQLVVKADSDIKSINDLPVIQ